MKKTRLKKVGAKTKRDLDIYNRSIKPLWMSLHPACQFKLRDLDPEITSDIECEETFGALPHHMMRRGKHLLDMQYLMTACPYHHDYIEAHKKWAREKGYILYK